MSARIVATTLLSLTVTGPTIAAATDGMLGDKGITALRACRAQHDEALRLACYDAAVERYLSFDFAGTGRESTPEFESPTGFRLGFRNEDVIFVIYVFDADTGELAKSYSAGPGEGEVAVRQGGRFYVEVKATGAWKIWIRPLPADGGATQTNQGKQ
ncbi:hypothetical protein SAHL_03950 [Salinisphaera orenii YIM 95161]|uniref:Uncharacterized protein n=1 Tax=Salinisphaera orenii YIM 95161 TaxID=1051139 RepID=A0A423Q469_9GAMM|nr:hypothetical protein SAHL_03950 [Salinisphaera halophila YIM 95161]